MAERHDAAGRLIAGRYRLTRHLGAGGMGRVWLAHDEELECDVALKEISVPPEIPEHELNARIARARGEARHSARLRGNPHVVTIYDCIVDAGLPWIVMEHVPGARDLEVIIGENGPLSPEDTARLGVALLDALMTGHQLGILHRDVKPSNILLTFPEPQGPRPAGLGRVLLSDYGISLQRDAGEPRLTTASGIVGTPGFLAPERARGAEPTPQADLFSLGATLYYAVEGHGPFDRSSYVATLTAVLTDVPTPPSRAGDLAPVLLKLLAKDPAQRLRADDAAFLLRQLTTESQRAPRQTITEMPQPIKQPSTPKPPPTPPQPAPTPASHMTRRNIALAAAALLVVGLGAWALVAGLGGSNNPSSSHSPSFSRTQTGPAMPYGAAVGLTQELHPGDCVTAHWTGEKFAQAPQITLVDCANTVPDGQVLTSDSATSVSDAQANGYNRCASDVKNTVNKMADARPYALPPTDQGWKSRVHNTACIVFNRAGNIYESVGPFRKLNDAITPQNAQTGDCYKVKENKTEYNAYLSGCDSPHNEQAVGFWHAPSDRSYSAELSASDECSQKYGSAYSSSTYGVRAILPDEDTWKQGFHYLMCTVYRLDRRKLTASVVPESS
ncbi:protein kinase [Streptomyces sp. NPDC049541]|uniref:serine/threonine-protein kinase n=1 Tax=Streptomyces sp. NPDC049541 TaxID=3365594 RepID=UPI00379595F1